MAIPAYLAKQIAEAKARTEKMLADAEAARVGNTQSQTEVLPSSERIQAQGSPAHDTSIAEQIATKAEDRMITINGSTFNPYEIEIAPGQFLQLNEEQQSAVDLFGLQGKSGCLIGPAGTGKTTTMRALIRAIILSGRVPMLKGAHKYLKEGIPGIWGGSFTRIATRNLKDNTPADIKGNIHTIHRLLEYEPAWETVPVKDKRGNIIPGETKEIKVFRPTRNKYRPLPASLKVFIIDEASMPGTQLHANLIDAIGCDDYQIIYIGDIAQLPPVMDESVFGYKLLELPVVELKHVYRHAGAIVNLANHIRVGNTIPENKKIIPYVTNLTRMPKKLAEEGVKEWSKEEDGSKVTLHLWKSRLDGEVGQLRALQNLNNFFKREITEGNYDPLKHMILIPYNKAVGTLELNKYIADFLGKQRKSEVWEIIAGFAKHYFAVGDKVFYDREESVITEIVVNGLYSGRIPQGKSEHLDRWGHNKLGMVQSDDVQELMSVDAILASVSIGEDDEERKNQCSHILKIQKLRDLQDIEEQADGVEREAPTYEVSTAAEVNNLLFGYALTIHKSQGSQWPKVYCVFHNSHNRNLQRELLYTAITRAQKELYVIAEPETFIQGVLSQHIVGNTLAEKAEYFKGKVAGKDKRDKLFNGDQ